MASMTMAASFLGGAMTKNPSSSSSSPARRSLIVAKATEGKSVNVKAMESSRKEEGGNNGRRDLVFAGAAVAACSIAKIAFAEDEPKRGTPEAKKKYNVICVTMPTARICRN
ncbi:photosystem II 5 kDa protein, chloroplastic [Prosopis cineraria]|uniref:photosystem II 5 kDa protein, chloroplastic n=1 Tax=Prosopis cineraria TaxID=364024 RepID=UPI00240FA007|nr:photosystem II 5 kDa protein, chloroplastic [Prosopis cineraria]